MKLKIDTFYLIHFDKVLLNNKEFSIFLKKFHLFLKKIKMSDMWK
jgi:hypothetical protein